MFTPSFWTKAGNVLHGIVLVMLFVCLSYGITLFLRSFLKPISTEQVSTCSSVDYVAMQGKIQSMIDKIDQQIEAKTMNVYVLYNQRDFLSDQVKSLPLSHHELSEDTDKK